jgi:phospholipase C
LAYRDVAPLKPPRTDTRFPTDLPNQPFRTEQFADIEQVAGDAWHRFYKEQLQIDGGKMDKFVAWWMQARSS